MNKVILIGRLTKDPELKFTNGSGVAVATFGLAVDRGFIGQDGQKETDFINIVTWRKLAENCANNIGKGRLVAISGSIRTRNYIGNDGKKVYITEVVADDVRFLDWPKDGTQRSNDYHPSHEESDDFIPINDEDIPF